MIHFVVENFRIDDIRTIQLSCMTIIPIFESIYSTKFLDEKSNEPINYQTLIPNREQQLKIKFQTFNHLLIRPCQKIFIKQAAPNQSRNPDNLGSQLLKFLTSKCEKSRKN